MSTELVSASHQDLLTCPPIAALTTVMPDGQPQTTAVWFDFDGTYFQVNTMRGFQKEKNMRRNMQRNPKVTLLIVDPQDTTRFIEIRGDAELVEAGAIAHLDQVTRQYTGHPQFYGYVYPVEKQEKETRVICRIHAKRINLDAIHR